MDKTSAPASSARHRAHPDDYDWDPVDVGFDEAGDPICEGYEPTLLMPTFWEVQMFIVAGVQPSTVTQGDERPL